MTDCGSVGIHLATVESQHEPDPVFLRNALNRLLDLGVRGVVLKGFALQQVFLHLSDVDLQVRRLPCQVRFQLPIVRTPRVQLRQLLTAL